MTRLWPYVLVLIALATLLCTALVNRIDDVEVETVPHQLNPSPADGEATSFAYVLPTTTTEAPTTTTTVLRRKTARVTASGAVYPSDDLLDRLAYCETGGTMDPATNTGNGFYGAFQFMVETWWSVGGEGYPHEHPYEVQRELARTLILQDGWHHFPACSRRIGAR